MDKKMENEMETGVIQGYIGLYWGYASWSVYAMLVKSVSASVVLPQFPACDA